MCRLFFEEIKHFEKFADNFFEKSEILKKICRQFIKKIKNSEKRSKNRDKLTIYSKN